MHDHERCPQALTDPAHETCARATGVITTAATTATSSRQRRISAPVAVPMAAPRGQQLTAPDDTSLIDNSITLVRVA